MSEKEARGVLRRACGAGDWTVIEAALAAAEERGRRRGVEEAAKYVEAFEGYTNAARFAKEIRALAPRDSGNAVKSCWLRDCKLQDGHNGPHDSNPVDRK